MTYITEDIARTLREARESRGLSQRDLSAAAGVPQGHISKIEKGAVDLRLSSLIQLARALDLELTLIPRKSVPAVRSIVRTTGVSTAPNMDDARKTRHELIRLRQAIERLATDQLPEKQREQFRRTVQELQHLPLSQADLKNVREVSERLRRSLTDPNRKFPIELGRRLRDLRNYLTHQPETTFTPKPAYSLDEDEDA